MNGLSERMVMRKVAEILGYRSMRSVYRWCRNNGVGILSDFGTRRKYVLAAEFRLKYLSATISHLRSQYGETHLQDALDAYLQSDLPSILKFTKEVHTSQYANHKKSKKKYGPNELRFEETLKQLSANQL